MKAFRFFAAAVAGSLLAAPAAFASTAEAGATQQAEVAPAAAEGIAADSLRSVAPPASGNELLDDALAPRGQRARGEAARAGERARSWQSLLPGSIQ